MTDWSTSTDFLCIRFICVTFLNNMRHHSLYNSQAFTDIFMTHMLNIYTPHSMCGMLATLTSHVVVQVYQDFSEDMVL